MNEPADKKGLEVCRWLAVCVLGLLVAGCAERSAQRRPMVNIAPLPRATISTAAAVAPQPVKPITLAWSNPNPTGWILETDFYSTTNLFQPFQRKCTVPHGVYTVTFMPTNTAEFFICRFRDPATGEVSTWNVK